MLKTKYYQKGANQIVASRYLVAAVYKRLKNIGLALFKVDFLMSGLRIKIRF